MLPIFALADFKGAAILRCLSNWPRRQISANRIAPFEVGRLSEFGREGAPCKMAASILVADYGSSDSETDEETSAAETEQKGPW